MSRDTEGSRSRKAGKVQKLCPGGTTEALPGRDALIILPGAAFDRKGNRLGYGGGFYDTYLAAHPQAGRAAIAFALQIAEDIPSAPHDIRPDIIVTEKEMIQCIQDSRETR